MFAGMLVCVWTPSLLWTVQSIWASVSVTRKLSWGPVIHVNDRIVTSHKNIMYVAFFLMHQDCSWWFHAVMNQCFNGLFFWGGMGWIGLLCTFHATLPLLDQVSHLYFGAGCLVPRTEALDSFRNWLGNCIFHYMLWTAVFTLTFTVLKKNSCYVVTLLPNHKTEESRRKGIRMI